MNISFPSASTSFTTRFFGTYWRQRIVCALTGTSAARSLTIMASDRLQAARLKTGSKDAQPFGRVHGHFGYGVPRAQLSDVALADVAAPVDAGAGADAFAADGDFRRSIPAGPVDDDPGGGDDDPGGGNSDGVVDNAPALCSTTSMTSTSRVSPSFATGASLNTSNTVVVALEKTTEAPNLDDSAWNADVLHCNSCAKWDATTRLWSMTGGCSCDYGDG